MARIFAKHRPMKLALTFLTLLFCQISSCTHSTQLGGEKGRLFIKLDLSPQAWPYSRNGYLKFVVEVQGWKPIEKFIFPLEYKESKRLIKELNIEEEDILDWNRIQNIPTDLTGRWIESGKIVRVTLNEMVPALLRHKSVVFRVNGDVVLEVYFANKETPYSPLSIRRIR